MDRFGLKGEVEGSCGMRWNDFDISRDSRGFLSDNFDSKFWPSNLLENLNISALEVETEFSIPHEEVLTFCVRYFAERVEHLLLECFKLFSTVFNFPLEHSLGLIKYALTEGCFSWSTFTSLHSWVSCCDRFVQWISIKRK